MCNRASLIAQKIRQEPIFQPLIAEKGSESRNKNLSIDFKTLADVLIQETLRRDLTSMVVFTIIIVTVIQKKFFHLGFSTKRKTKRRGR